MATIDRKAARKRRKSPSLASDRERTSREPAHRLRDRPDVELEVATGAAGGAAAGAIAGPVGAVVGAGLH